MSVFPIRGLFWDGNNVEHLWQSHQVAPDEIEEIVLGCDGEDPVYRQRRDAGAGRLLKMVGEFLESGLFRVFVARDMDGAEKHAYRRG